MLEMPFDLSRVSRETLEELKLDRDTRERQNLEFKRSIQIESNEAKLELLNDISSFANSGGGDILFGVAESSEESGKMGEFVGIEASYDKLVQQIEQALDSHINPRIPGIRPHYVPLESGKFILVIRVPKSQIAPHMVTLNGSFRIWGRGTAGKRLLSTQQIRDLVLATDSLGERMRRFRSSRVSAAISEELPVDLSKPPFALCHLIPHESFSGETDFEIPQLIDAVRKGFFLPLGVGGQNWRPVFDGIISPSNYGISSAYSMMTREGVAEGLTSNDFGKHTVQAVSHKEECFIWDENLLQSTVEWFEQAQTVQNLLGLRPPFQASIQFVAVNGCFVGSATDKRIDHVRIRQDIIDLRTTEVESILSKAEWIEALRPLFDRLANAGGMVTSPLWNREGALVRQF